MDAVKACVVRHVDAVKACVVKACGQRWVKAQCVPITVQADVIVL